MAAQPGHLQNLSSVCTFFFLIFIKIKVDHNLFYPGIRNEPVLNQAWPCCDYNSSMNVSQFSFLQLKLISPALTRACRRSGQSLLPDSELNSNPKIQWIICIGCADPDQSVIDVLKRKLVIHNSL